MSGEVRPGSRSRLAMIWSRSFPRARSLAASIGAILPSREAFTELPPASRYLMTGLRVAIVLTGIVTIAAILASRVSVVMPSTSSEAGSSTVSTGESREKKAYDHVTARPVFARTRHATSAVVDTPADPPATIVSPAVAALDSNIVLRGVLISESLQKAFITSAQNPVGRWIQVDGEIDGWRLIEVKPDRITLEGQGQTLALKRSVSSK
ncbi:MAG TPA: hypothetical protein VNK51_09445 [Bradyrhizobium sp.]|nr:hypothetical protein [Bradyrhizobium sp.]